MGNRLVLIALAGALGAVLRYAVASGVQRWLGDPFPWGTLTVNLIGCFLFGMVWAAGESRLSPDARLVILVGFMGAFTTFSSFAFDSHRLLAEHHWGLVLVNVLVQNIVGVAAVSLGIVLGRSVA
ncbi:MAG: fluoride efflux transporter CrcB [Myxococcota bacterium]